MSSLRGHPFGLRSRILGVVLVTAVATLAVAALTLLGPLEQSLRNAQKTTLKNDLGRRGTLDNFADVPLDLVPLNGNADRALGRAEATLAGRIGEAVVCVLGAPASEGPLLKRCDNGET